MQILDKKMKSLGNVEGPEEIGWSNLLFGDDNKLPEKFKAPKFDKYDGTGCPRTHLKVY